MIIDLKRTLFPYAHALLMIDGGGSLVPDFSARPALFARTSQLLVIEKIKFRHHPELLDIRGPDHHGRAVGECRIAGFIELSRVGLTESDILVAEGNRAHRGWSLRTVAASSQASTLSWGETHPICGLLSRALARFSSIGWLMIVSLLRNRI